MTQEEKAKAYDEAIEKARQLCAYPTTKPFISDLQNLFPELKESEDEKIRKDLIIYLRSILSNKKYGDKFIESWIAWLEKQSNKPKWCHHKVDLSNCSEEYCKAYYDGWNNCNMQHSQCRSELDDVVKCLINGMKFYYEDNKEATWGTDKWSMPVKHIIEVLEKQGEKKSIDDLTQQEAMDIAVAKCFEQGEQKPADKVEPKFKIGDTVKSTFSGIQYYITDVHDYYYTTDTGCVIMFNSQDNFELSKQEWSEEDENYYDAIIAKLEVTQDDASLTDNQMKFLKSLKDRVQPQNRWKPSDELLDNLNYAANGGIYKVSLLEELYEQLKEIGGE